MPYIDQVQVGSTTYDIKDSTLQLATTESDGLMSAEDKAKLNQVTPGGLVYLDAEVTIAQDAWSNSAPYTYTWTNALVTSTCGLDVFFREGVYDNLIGSLTWEKVTGGVQFTTSELPEGAVPIVVRIIDSPTEGAFSLEAEIVKTTAISGETNVEGALTRINNNKANLSGLIYNIPGDTAMESIPQGSYLCYKGTYGTAKVNISSGTTIVPSTHITTFTFGGLLNSVQRDVQGKKDVQATVTSPTASGSASAFIDTITQNAQGVITPTKKNVYATDISMSSSDSTKVSANFASVNDVIATHDFGTVASLSAFETALNTYIATLSNNDTRNIVVTFSATSGLFGATSYIGTLARMYTTRTRIILQRTSPGDIIVGYQNTDGWNWEQLSDYATGLWNPHIYDLDTKVAEMGERRWYRFGKIYILQASNFPAMKIQTMLQIRNTPCDVIFAGGIYLANSGDSTKACDRGVQRTSVNAIWFRPNITCDLVASTNSSFWAMGYQS